MASIVCYIVLVSLVRPYVSFGDDAVWVACLLQLWITIYTGLPIHQIHIRYDQIYIRFDIDDMCF